MSIEFPISALSAPSQSTTTTAAPILTYQRQCSLCPNTSQIASSSLQPSTPDSTVPQLVLGDLLLSLILRHHLLLSPFLHYQEHHPLHPRRHVYSTVLCSLKFTRMALSYIQFLVLSSLSLKLQSLYVILKLLNMRYGVLQWLMKSILCWRTKLGH